MRKLFHGLYTALVTPFDAEGRVDYDLLRKLIQHQIKEGVDGIVLLGTTGEDPTLTKKERETIMSIGAEEIKNKAYFIVGTGSYSTTDTIEKTETAKKFGADAALVITPYYNKPTQEGLFRHFEALTKSVDLPICVYTHLGRTGQNLLPETLKRIANLPNIVAVKEASGSIPQVDEVISLFREHHLAILSGDDALALSIFALGGHGLISVSSNLIPKKMKELVDACMHGDFNKGRKLHHELNPFFKGTFIETNPIPIKAAMQMCGIKVGNCRLPLCELSSENKTKLTKVLQNISYQSCLTLLFITLARLYA